MLLKILLFISLYNLQTHAKSITNESTDVTLKWLDDQTVLELLQTLNSTLTIIDTRSSNEYNGWKSFEKYDYNPENVNIFSGHLKGALNFEIEWLFNFNESLINDLFLNRVGLSPAEDEYGNSTSEFIVYDILVYDTKLERLEAMRDYLLNRYKINNLYLYKIIDKKSLYDELVARNMTDTIEYEPQYNILISPEYLYSIIFNPVATTSRIVNLTQTTAVHSPIINYKLFDVSYGDENQFYMVSHIPTSVHIDTNEIEESPIWNRKDRAELIDLLAELGIRENNTELIIFYGNPDPMAAFRAAVVFKWLGVNNVHVLNGGYKAWLRRNFPIEKKFNKRVRVEKAESYFNGKIDGEMATYIVDMDFISDLVKNYNTFSEQYSLVDIRSWKEFTGEISGYNDLNKTGRIPGSVWGKAGSTASELEDYRNPDWTMRSANDIRKMWSQLGIDFLNKHLIFYCGSGWRAAEVLIYAEIMGLKKVSLYDGGWYEWSSSVNNTIENGLPHLSTFNWETSTVDNIVEVNGTVATLTDLDSTSSDGKNCVNILNSSFNLLFFLSLGCFFF
jgi:3-mercaptopyruvate sulfurtransferase SseA